jgi:tRNA:m4X modification enzyme
MFPYYKFLHDYGITENDFKRLCAMSSWAICGQRPAYETENNDNDDDDNEEDHIYDEAEDGEENNKCVLNNNLYYKLRNIFLINNIKFVLNF